MNIFKRFVRSVKAADAQKQGKRTAAGDSILCRQRMKPPAEAYWKTPSFIRLAQACERGAFEAMEAMEAMEDFFLHRAKADGVQERDAAFYTCAAQFWRARACMYGSKRAARAIDAWKQANPGKRMASPCLDEELNGVADGDLLNALGFLFFDEAREYALSGVDAQGVVCASSYESEDGPDEDGFGRETYYDWWYLDEYLTLPPGVGFIHSYSRIDKRCNEEKFRALHDRVAALVQGNPG